MVMMMTRITRACSTLEKYIKNPLDNDIPSINRHTRSVRKVSDLFFENLADFNEARLHEATLIPYA